MAFDLDRALLDECVHCGFCLPTCPTYAVTGDEAESPRGRIYLMDLATRGEAPVAGPVTQHLDSCLGCLACVPACPSGVKYNQLIESARPQLDREVPRDRFFRSMIFTLFPYPRRLRVAALAGVLYQRLGLRWLTRRSGLLGRLPARARALEGLLPPVRAKDLFARTKGTGTGQTRGVALLTGCAQRVFFKPVNDATVRVLAAEGCRVDLPKGQGCCGALSLHTGRDEEARAFARRTVDAFEGYETVVVNVAGCGSVLKEYGELLRDDPGYAERAAAFAARVRDVSEVLAELEPVARRQPLPLRVAYHDACHLANAQRITRQPRDALRTIPGLELVEVPEEKICCGSAGVYNLLQPAMAERLGRRKAENLASARPDVIATGNAGCLLQIRRYAEGGPLIMHPVELLDWSIHGTAH
ncbi:heterodisulfide reductase-related iron-sulfur binding cluster [Phytohabitans sp. ZYX-F-186]|uniref:Glycolate oxidase iron-sulfur subunit n=1 Tax=Phytohabitans maris TaxID=3071409 RepID=A0ABU0ZN13_9ACTN|nr:heterodisulfide reductase-related iron-sulfur binding cluster [Phytohabitans sp. ZYX-F-186]MDQ7908428.1 heterodisulfide reductase-related iron-sulfur binding cluster [Phytohabitans sp. ZYX-F-186]